MGDSASMLLLLISLSLASAQTSSVSPLVSDGFTSFCCLKKTVTNSPDGNLDGVYTLKLRVSAEAQDPHCSDGCVYTRNSGSAEDEYCFRAVDLTQAATIEEQCEATTFPPGSSSTSWAGSTLPSADQLKQNIEEANALITRNQALIAEKTESVAAAEEAANTIGSIAADLGSSSVSTTPEATTNAETTNAETTNSGTTKAGTSTARTTNAGTTNGNARRVKRQATTNIMGSTLTPINSCSDFDTAFNSLLDLVAAVTADSLAAIRALSNVLSAADVNALCTEADKVALATATSAKIETAQATVESYKAEVEATLVQLKTEVNKAVAAVAAANTLLQTQYNEATIPQAPASTFNVPTTAVTPEFTFTSDSTVAGTTTEVGTTNDDTTEAGTTNEDTTLAGTTNDDTTSDLTRTSDTTISGKLITTQAINKRRLFFFRSRGKRLI